MEQPVAALPPAGGLDPVAILEQRRTLLLAEIQEVRAKEAEVRRLERALRILNGEPAAPRVRRRAEPDRDRWTAQEDVTLMDGLREGLSMVEIGARLKRTERAVDHRRRRLLERGIREVEE